MDRRLPELLPAAEQRPEPVHRAMHYALTGAGKRVRPVLTLVVAELFGSRPDAVLDLACAVEMVHACSLVLDDLPSMDDARRRRGRPALHVVHGVATAELAAVALLSRAFEILAAADAIPGAARTRILRELAGAVGAGGCCAGQAADLSAEPAAVSRFLRLSFCSLITVEGTLCTHAPSPPSIRAFTPAQLRDKWRHFPDP